MIRILAFIVLCTGAAALLGISFRFRTNPTMDDFYMVPLWALLLLLYAYWGLACRRLRGLYFALLPIALLAIVEIVWGTWALSTRYTRAQTIQQSAVQQGALPQPAIDAVYTELFRNKTFFSDGFRAYVLPGNFRSPYVTTNTDGFRARSPGPKPAGTIRIALLGGSSAFGWQAASDENTVATQLEKILNGNSEWKGLLEVVNFAIPAGNSLVDRSIVAGYVDRYEIDGLLFLTGSNDLNGSVRNVEMVSDFASNYLNRADDVDYAAGLWATVSQQLALRAVTRIKTLDYVAKNVLKTNDNSSDPWIGESGGALAEKYIDGYFANMEQIFKYAQRRLLPVLVVHQPTLTSTRFTLGQALTDEDDRKTEQEMRNNQVPRVQVFTTRVPALVERGDQIARQYGFRYLNGNDAFSGYKPTGKLRQDTVSNTTLDGPLYISSSHYSLAGARLIAAYIAKQMLDLKFVQPQGNQ